MTPTAQTTEKKTTPAASTDSASKKQGAQRGRTTRGGKRGGKNDRGNRRDDRSGRNKPEFDHAVLDIRRVTRVVRGGRRFSFRVTLVAGDRRGRVGVGMGKAADTPLAIEKAFRDAKQNMVTVTRTKDNSIPCEVEAKYNASRVLMKPSPGKGVIAGGAVRPVLEFAGVHDVSTKLLSRSKNSLNNARATIEALKSLPVVKVEKEGETTTEKKEEKEGAATDGDK